MSVWMAMVSCCLHFDSLEALPHMPGFKELSQRSLHQTSCRGVAGFTELCCGVFFASGVVVIELRGLLKFAPQRKHLWEFPSFVLWVSVFEGVFFWCTEEPKSDLLRINQFSISILKKFFLFFFLNQFRNSDFFFLLVVQSLNLSRDGEMEHVYMAAPAGRVGYNSCRK